ncbi:odorant receptor 131-2-like [Pseudophryne corroboree]|uniref:odorant receptor 131-2-like n=1 Tax=Pseudophryne corroboree TaxID=495146 RepID=UPI00308153F2
MANSTQLNGTMTAQDNKTTSAIRTTVLVVMLSLFCIFLYFMSVILNAFFTVPHVRQNPRYILFIHMLVNDLVYLAVSFLLFTFVVYLVYMPVPICYTILTFSTCAFRITPYNLAAMSLERYAAICHPLRHAELCTAQRSSSAIAIMWTVGLIPQLADFIAFCFSVEKRVFSLNILCNWPDLTVNEVQEVLKIVSTVLSFTTVGLIIAYTYIQVMLVAQRIVSGKSASKAGKTVLLHAFQLMLCMLSFNTSHAEKYLTPYFYFTPLMNFFLLICIPRFINPLIYGVRDEVLGKHMRKVQGSWSTSSETK